MLNQLNPNFTNSLKFIGNYPIQPNQSSDFPALVFITVQNESENCGDKPIKTPLAG